MGTGKTTIMQNLNNHKDIAKMFDIVIWAPKGVELEDVARCNHAATKIECGEHCLH